MGLKYRLTIIIYAIAFSYASYKTNNIENLEYEILNDNNKAYATYEDGYVYIGDERYINNLKNIDEHDVLIKSIPEKEDMKIMSSYLIKDKKKRNEIINILNNYKETHNTSWNRSIDSMKLEWYIHNLLYELNYKKERTADVDFANEEENKYNIKVLKKLLKL